MNKPPKILFSSRRLFEDGALNRPIIENDPVNIAFALNGDYASFYTIKRLRDAQLKAKFSAYDLVIFALETEDLETAARIADACPGRYATYSEGHIYNYQFLPPLGQALFVDILRRSVANFLYFEKYIPFYESLSGAPAIFLPYPYPVDEIRALYQPQTAREKRAILPSGLSGLTRNGLSSTLVAKALLETDAIGSIDVWLNPSTARSDIEAIQHLLDGSSVDRSAALSSEGQRSLGWRDLLVQSGIDYRVLLKMRDRWIQTSPPEESDPKIESIGPLNFFPRSKWINYLNRSASATLLIDMNNRETVGRNALDCAALGIPAVATGRSDLQERLFPQTTIADAWEIPQAVEMANRLLHDSKFYAEVVDSAAAELEQFRWKAFKGRFESITQDLQLGGDT